MTSLSLAQGGPRPAALPPTLQPNAIAAMAPPTDKRVSVGLSVLTYGLLGTALAFAAAVKAEIIKVPVPTERPGTIIELNPKPVEAQLVTRPSAPAALVRQGDGTRPPDVAPVDRPQSTSQVPDDTPAALPSGDHSRDGMYNAAMPVGTGQGGSPNGVKDAGASTTGSEHGVLGGGAPVQLAEAQVQVLSQVQPAYPQMARITRIQGPVVLLMTIDAQGVPTDVQAVSGHSVFYPEAVKAARQWRFAPALSGGRAVPATFRLTINFTLR